jgi:hypothetical protein
MSRRPRKNEISIGQDRWISFGDLDGGQARAIEIDPHLALVMPFFNRLETECVADCCGIDAYRLWPEDIKKAVATLDQPQLEKLARDLVSALSEIEQLPCDTVVSTRLNQYFRKAVFISVLAHISKVVES